MRVTPGIDETLLGPQGPTAGGVQPQGPGAAPGPGSVAPGTEPPTDASAGTTPGTGAGAGVPAGAMVGEYRVEKEIGRGGMGAVYAASHPVIGKRVAIKVLSPALSADPSVVKRFVDEARAANKIGHPNIIDIFSFGQLPDGRHYFVMEYLEGETLGGRLERGALDGTEARRFLVQICEALAAAHAEQIVHRDLKPENIWIARPRHGEAFIKVLDFGIAKLIEQGESNSNTQTGTVMGTPYYMSPEQCTGRGVDHRTDIYALGVMLYRIFAGRLPFEGESFAEVVAQQLTTKPAPPSQHASIAPALEALILACLEKEPGRRPQTASELARRLADVLENPGRGATASLAAEGAAGAGSGVETMTPALAGAAIAQPTQAGRAGSGAGSGTSVSTAETALGLGGGGTQVGYATLASAPGSGRRSTVLVALVVAGVAVGVIAALVLKGAPKVPTDSAGADPGAGAARPTLPTAPAAPAVPPPSAPAAGTALAPNPSTPSAGSTAAAAGSAAAGASTGPAVGSATPAPSNHPRAARIRGAEPTAQPAAPAAPAATPDRGPRSRSRAEKQGLVQENPFE